MEFDKYNNKGLTGLTNLGNTCFLNSTLQVISHTYELNDFLNKGEHLTKLNKKNDSVILLEWNELRKLMWKENCVISPVKFVKNIQTLSKLKGIDNFTGFAQNDLPEFLCFLIDCFHNALSRKVEMTIEGKAEDEKDLIAIKCLERIKQMYENDYSEIWKMFYGIHISRLENSETNKIISMVPEPFFIIDLPIPVNKIPTLMDCFDLYVKSEILDGENKVLNEETKELIIAKKNIAFWSLPDILVLDIKRFNSYNKKNKMMVDFPIENLNLSKYVIGYKQTSYVYDLYGVCNHMGNAMGGHYTSFVKNANGNWYHYNDTRVSLVKNKTDIKTPNAYCFFYRKRK